jgi:hypothetical protein
MGNVSPRVFAPASRRACAAPGSRSGATPARRYSTSASSSNRTRGFTACAVHLPRLRRTSSQGTPADSPAITRRARRSISPAHAASTSARFSVSASSRLARSSAATSARSAIGNVRASRRSSFAREVMWPFYTRATQPNIALAPGPVHMRRSRFSRSGLAKAWLSSRRCFKIRIGGTRVPGVAMRGAWPAEIHSETLIILSHLTATSSDPDCRWERRRSHPPA